MARHYNMAGDGQVRVRDNFQSGGEAALVRCAWLPGLVIPVLANHTDSLGAQD
jgi:hypothetical protein